MKPVKIITVILTLVLMLSATVQSQTTTKKSIYPQWSLAPVAGIGFPIGAFGDNFKSGLTFGLDLSNKINKEVGFYAKLGYYIFPTKIEGATDGKYLEYTAGPRYYFTSKNLKSSIFFEVGLGGYSFMQDAYTLTVDTVSTNVAEKSTTNFGINGGIGAVLNLGKSIDLLVKFKYHNVLTSDGSTSFIAPVLGIDIRF